MVWQPSQVLWLEHEVCVVIVLFCHINSLSWHVVRVEVQEGVDFVWAQVTTGELHGQVDVEHARYQGNVVDAEVLDAEIC